MNKNEHETTELNDFDNIDEMNIDQGVDNDLHLIELKMQKIDSILEKYEDKYYNTGEEILSEDEVKNLQTEYGELKKQRKKLIRGTNKTMWDYIPTWMVFYSIFQFVFSFFYILTEVSRYFAFWSFDIFEKVFGRTETLLIVLYFIIPFISLILSLIILLFLKEKRYKKIFAIIYAIQGLETLIAVIIMINGII